LFDEPEGTVISVVKNTLRNIQQGNTVMIDGVRYMKVFMSIDLLADSLVDYIDRNDTIEGLMRMFPGKRGRYIFSRLLEGYTPLEISQELGITRQAVYNQVRYLPLQKTEPLSKRFVDKKSYFNKKWKKKSD
jgi:hypothetical protein